MTPVYNLTRHLFRAWFSTALEIDVRGLDHIPRDGPGILVGNHASALDPFLVMVLVNRPIRTLVLADHFGTWLFRWYAVRMGWIPAGTGGTGIAWFKTGIDALRRGELLMVAPEGGIHPGPELGLFHGGFARLAAHAHAPVIPVAVHGAADALKNPYMLGPLRPACIGLEFLAPRHFAGAARDRHALEEFVAEVRDAIGTRLTFSKFPTLDPPVQIFHA